MAIGHCASHRGTGGSSAAQRTRSVAAHCGCISATIFTPALVSPPPQLSLPLLYLSRPWYPVSSLASDCRESGSFCCSCSDRSCHSCSSRCSTAARRCSSAANHTWLATNLRPLRLRASDQLLPQRPAALSKLCPSNRGSRPHCSYIFDR